MKLKYLLYWAFGLICVALNPVLQFVMRRNDPQRHRFYNLADEIHKAYKDEDFDKTENLASEYLKLAERFTQDWNYGNAIDTSHQALGLIQLRRGNVEKAKKHLIAAGKTPGSPQLDSYGQQMKLARELLEKGESEVVIRYLNLIAKFLTKDDMPEFQHLVVEHKALIDQWKSEVKEGRVPNHKQWS